MIKYVRTCILMLISRMMIHQTQILSVCVNVVLSRGCPLPASCPQTALVPADTDLTTSPWVWHRLAAHYPANRTYFASPRCSELPLDSFGTLSMPSVLAPLASARSSTSISTVLCTETWTRTSSGPRCRVLSVSMWLCMLWGTKR